MAKATQPNTRVAMTDDSAELERRADRWEFDDPFSDLMPSLLSAEQIANYNRVVGLIDPFEETHLKSTTYEVGISDTVYWWDKDELKTVEALVGDVKGVVLEPNSITFVQTDVEFRLPHYVAMRFNLHIKLVHRGLLLGTGPIVDPGFRGKLLIPLHNLTSTRFTIQPGEKIIWVEFSKTLYGQQSSDEGYQTSGDPHYKRFPPSKRRRSPSKYFDNANAGNPIVSSISGFISDVNDRVEKTDRKINNIGIAGLVALVISLSGAVWGSWSVYNNAQTIIRADEARRDQIEARLRHLEECTTLPRRVRDSRGNPCPVSALPQFQ